MDQSNSSRILLGKIGQCVQLSGNEINACTKCSAVLSTVTRRVCEKIAPNVSQHILSQNLYIIISVGKSIPKMWATCVIFTEERTVSNRPYVG
jgi:hypothetical protein